MPIEPPKMLEPPAPPPVTRFEILQEAAETVGRNEDEYGRPENNFASIAAMWSGFLEMQIDPWMVGAMMAMLKFSRMKKNPKNRDNHVDACGYPSITAEVALNS